MTQGELEKLPLKIEQAFSDLETRIMTDIVRRIKLNGFSTASADWQIERLRQLGKSEDDISDWVKEALKITDAELDQIFSDTVYQQYTGNQRAYKLKGMQQILYKDNIALQQLTEAVRAQLSQEYENLAGSMGFAIRDPSGRIQYSPVMEYYRTTLDNAVLDIQSGAFSYQMVLRRTVNQMTASGLRWIDYDSGTHNRVDVTARRAVLTGFRQVQGRINEQVANDLGTDSYEVTWHAGARPTHQPWQGRVYTYRQLQDVCGLGTVTGLHGANCYHDYNAFIPGVSVRIYTDEWLDEQNRRENMPKTYNGKEYTTYEALQQQRKMETTMRKYRQDIKLLQEGGGSDEEIMLKSARYQGKMQEYKAFSKAMGLPEQKSRIYQDGLGSIKAKSVAKTRKNVTLKSSKWSKEAIESRSRDEKILAEYQKEHAVLYDGDGNRIFQKSGEAHNVSFTKKEVEKMRGGVLTHNHPGGATFSEADIYMLKESGLTQIRAIGRDGVYILDRPDIWPEELDTYEKIVECYAKIEKELETEMQEWALKDKTVTIIDYQIKYQNAVISELSRRYGLKYKMEAFE